MNNVYLHLGKYLWGNIAPILRERGVWKRTIWAREALQGAHPDHEERARHLGPHSYRGIDPELYDRLYPRLYQFMSMYARNNKVNQFGYSLKTIHDFVDIFNIQINYYATTFADEAIDLAVFNRAPHTGADFIAYHVARALGIKTLILQRNHFPGRFFHVFEHEDYGLFRTSRILENPEPMPIERQFEKDLPYVEAHKRKSLRDRARTWPEYAFLAKTWHRGNIGEAAFQYVQERKYRYWNQRLTVRKPDTSGDFVYFPLHFQPEQNTTAWGGMYDDQLLAIEQLSRKLPDGWKILVKENPLQPGFMRGKWFYERLNGIANAELVPVETDTYELLHKCRFAATITGTVGWESITGGKPVLVFGPGCWYRTLPGVVFYSHDFRVEDILNTQIDHDELQEAVGQLLARCGRGEIFKRIGHPNPHLESTENHTRIADSIQRMLT
ncbi:capsular polysaccharide export protein, LipB/KpsS family [Wenzhouxiangella sp. EGI_FJ10409]|uniref:capsular polysaccharide export protein, LipB/KpsS family n=1 Tax=Wenzhouxiangella sp. EGI_FJ10409 TaxID=3243767 RepID=UPI0035D5DC1C